jgi:UTP--glucose-1-phosphate uridylyltransferase
LNEVQRLANVEIHYIRQKEPLGLGHAVWCARRFIGNEPFAVLLGDDIVSSKTPCLKQLIMQYDQTESPIIGVQTVPDDQTSRYGIIDPSEQFGRLSVVRNMVEKPPLGTAPSNIAIMGRYILTPDIFDFLERQEIGANGEIQLTDAIQKLNELRQVYAYNFEGTRYDVGEKLGFILTTLDYALKSTELRYPVLAAIEEIINQERAALRLSRHG